VHILGISCFYHDAAAALLRDGQLVAAADEERFSRRKHDSGFPANAVAFCLRQGGIGAGDLDYVVFYEKPFPKFERILRTALASFPRSCSVFRESMMTWLSEKLWIRSIILDKVGVSPDKLLFVDHHVAHAASALFCSPFEEAAILTVDGVGEWTTTAVGRGTATFDGNGRNDIILEKETRFPHSLGLLYSAFTAWLGFEVNEGEYKVMGMAPYGQPRYLDRVDKLITVYDDGSFWLDMDYFDYHRSPTQTYSRRFADLFGAPRQKDSLFVTLQTDPDTDALRPLIEQNQYYADVAASIQRKTDEVILRLCHNLHRDTGLTRLCMGGGVALNSVANGRILRETGFTDLFIQPAAGDPGGALGAALYVWHVLLGKPRTFVLEHAYWGEEFSDGEVKRFLDQEGVSYQAFDNAGRLVRAVADDLEAGKVIGWSQGRFEWGPRALGHRSILADPRSAEMKDLVNSKIKFREPFRPFAPVILEERASEFFEGLDEPARQYPARYMLLVLPWKGDAGDLIPAVNHMGTGRLQTVRREWNPLYYDVVKEFGDRTGVPVVMNTSFNLRGEPIVNSPADAYSTFVRSGIDCLRMGSFLIRKA